VRDSQRNQTKVETKNQHHIYSSATMPMAIAAIIEVKNGILSGFPFQKTRSSSRKLSSNLNKTCPAFSFSEVVKTYIDSKRLVPIKRREKSEHVS